MKKKKHGKTHSKNTAIKPPVMEAARPTLCSVQNSCTGPCPCPAMKPVLAEKERLVASLLKEKARLLEELAKAEAEQRELEQMLIVRQRKERR
jgi:hypothetical protein